MLPPHLQVSRGTSAFERTFRRACQADSVWS